MIGERALSRRRSAGLLRGDRLAPLRWTLPVRGNLLPVHAGFVIAALPIVAATLVLADRDQATGLLVRLSCCLVGAWAVCRAFAWLRGRPVDGQWPMHATLYALLVPFGAGTGPMLYGLLCGLVFGALVFGGGGRYLVSPALVGALFLSLSYPVTPTAAVAAPDAATLWVDGSATAPAALSTGLCALGAALLVAFGHASWRVIAGAAAGLAIAAVIGDGIAVTWGLATSGGFAFALAFLVTDPTAASVTRPGRVGYGALFALLFAWLAGADPAPPSPALAAALSAAMCAPLIDYAVGRIAGRGHHGG